MIIKITNVRTRRNFFKFNTILGLSLFLKPQEAKAIVPLLAFLGRVLVGSAIRKVGQDVVRKTVVRSAVARTTTTAGVIATVTTAELQAKASDLTENEIYNIADKLNYPSDNYGGIWVKGDSSNSNTLNFEIDNTSNEELSEIVEVAILNENNKLESASIPTRIKVPRKSTSVFNVDFDLKDFTNIGAKKIVILGKDKVANGVHEKVIIEDFDTIRRVMI